MDLSPGLPGVKVPLGHKQIPMQNSFHRISHSFWTSFSFRILGHWRQHTSLSNSALLWFTSSQIQSFSVITPLNIMNAKINGDPHGVSPLWFLTKHSLESVTKYDI